MADLILLIIAFATVLSLYGGIATYLVIDSKNHLKKMQDMEKLFK